MKRGWISNNRDTLKLTIDKVRFEYSEDGENWTKCPDEFTTGQTSEDAQHEKRFFEFPTPFRAKKVRFFVTEKSDPVYGGRFDYLVTFCKDQEPSIFKPKEEGKEEKVVPSDDKPFTEQAKEELKGDLSAPKTEIFPHTILSSHYLA